MMDPALSLLGAKPFFTMSWLHKPLGFLFFYSLLHVVEC